MSILTYYLTIHTSYYRPTSILARNFLFVLSLPTIPSHFLLFIPSLPFLSLSIIPFLLFPPRFCLSLPFPQIFFTVPSLFLSSLLTPPPFLCFPFPFYSLPPSFLLSVFLRCPLFSLSFLYILLRCLLIPSLFPLLPFPFLERGRDGYDGSLATAEGRCLRLQSLCCLYCC